MILVNFQNGRGLSMRGQRLGLVRRILISLRIPTAYRSSTSEDWYLIMPASVSAFQVVDDEVAAARRKAAEEAQKKELENAPRVVRPVPKFSIPH